MFITVIKPPSMGSCVIVKITSTNSNHKVESSSSAFLWRCRKYLEILVPRSVLWESKWGAFCFVHLGVQWAWQSLQPPAHQCTGALCRDSGHCTHPQQGQHTFHEHHYPLGPHGHISEPGCGLGHWRWVKPASLQCQVFCTFCHSLVIKLH